MGVVGGEVRRGQERGRGVRGGVEAQRTAPSSGLASGGREPTVSPNQKPATGLDGPFGEGKASYALYGP